MKYLEHPTINEALPALARVVMDEGDEVGSRGGERVMEIMHPHVVLTDPKNREILSPHRKANIVAQIAETMWVLAGRNDVKWLERYLPRAPEFSDDGETWRGGYGPRLRAWTGADWDEPVDQLRHVVDLLKKDRTTRRAVMSIYDPAVDTQPGKDIPCNNWLHFTSRLGALDLHVATRSNDLIWGWSGINAFEWSVLQEIVAGLLGLSVGSLHFSIGSLHIYDRHWKRADEIAKAGAFRGEAFLPSPRFDASVVHNFGPADEHPVERLDDIIRQWFDLEGRIRQHWTTTDIDTILKDVQAFPEPMFRSWLAVIAWYWTGSERFLEPYRGTRLAVAASMWKPAPKPEKIMIHSAEAGIIPLAKWDGAIGRVLGIPTKPVPDVDEEFVEFVEDLHNEKHKAYGDSWKRRGEMLGILANIARKVDRLGVAGAGDTAADTAIDLMVYLIKYRLWLIDTYGTAEDRDRFTEWAGRGDVLAAPFSDHTQPVAAWLSKTAEMRGTEKISEANAIQEIKSAFDRLERAVAENAELPERSEIVERMIWVAFPLARQLWHHEKWQAENATRVWNPEAEWDPDSEDWKAGDRG